MRYLSYGVAQSLLGRDCYAARAAGPVSTGNALDSLRASQPIEPESYQGNPIAMLSTNQWGRVLLVGSRLERACRASENAKNTSGAGNPRANVW